MASLTSLLIILLSFTLSSHPASMFPDLSLECSSLNTHVSTSRLLLALFLILPSQGAFFSTNFLDSALAVPCPALLLSFSHDF